MTSLCPWVLLMQSLGLNAAAAALDNMQKIWSLLLTATTGADQLAMRKELPWPWQPGRISLLSLR